MVFGDQAGRLLALLAERFGVSNSAMLELNYPRKGQAREAEMMLTYEY